MRILSMFQGIVFLGLVFFVGPNWVVSDNERLGWPVWHSDLLRLFGWVLIAVGVAVMVYCSGLFRRLGEGTPVPIEPPKKLVVEGLYHYSRNPIYVADLIVLLGIFCVRGALALLVYTGVVFALIELWVLVREEPVLRARFGEAYEDYTRRVPRWIGRRSPS